MSIPEKCNPKYFLLVLPQSTLLMIHYIDILLRNLVLSATLIRFKEQNH